MKYQLRIQLRSAEGAVVRTLGLLERRGFRIDSLHLAEAQGDGQSMLVSVSSQRPGDLIKRQLERLHDVLWVELNTGTTPWNQPADLASVSGS